MMWMRRRGQDGHEHVSDIRRWIKTCKVPYLTGIIMAISQFSRVLTYIVNYLTIWRKRGTWTRWLCYLILMNMKLILMSFSCECLMQQHSGDNASTLSCLGSLPNSFKTFLVNLMFSFFLMSQRQVVDWWPSNSFHRGVLSTAPCIFSYLLNWHYVLFVHQGACSCLEKPFYPASYLGCQSILPLSVLLPQNSLHSVGHFCSNFARGCGSHTNHRLRSSSKIYGYAPEIPLPLPLSTTSPRARHHLGQVSHTNLWACPRIMIPDLGVHPSWSAGNDCDWLWLKLKYIHI